MDEKCHNSSVSANLPLCSSASGYRRGHTAEQGNSPGYLMSTPLLSLWPTTVFWINCIAFITRACGQHKPCVSPCVGTSGRALSLGYREFILCLSIPTYNAGITTLPLFTTVQLHCWHLYWAQEAARTSALMLLHKLGISSFPVGVTVTISTYLDAPLHFSCFYPTHASFVDFPLKTTILILKWWEQSSFPCEVLHLMRQSMHIFGSFCHRAVNVTHPFLTSQVIMQFAL